ncbi:MAG TPA: 2-C-methyl-D-erythritol 4-phosphate cytidylyltransferase [Actinomycetota bacterium]|nr:2-C-methyl-D-erythritol 4-phosphate cytidylyltransferase [Actinomycetota bacterium]
MDGAAAIVLAGGRGERLDASLPKGLVPVGGVPIVARAVERVTACPSIAEVIVVAPPGFEERVEQLVRSVGATTVVGGGESRQASVRAGLRAVRDDTAVVVCHDSARAFASPELFKRVIEALDGWDGAIPVLRVVDTVKRVEGQVVKGTEPRSMLAFAQTPQAFVRSAIVNAHASAERDAIEDTDDAALLERTGYRIRAIEGEGLNLKITTPDDLRLAEALDW